MLPVMAELVMTGIHLRAPLIRPYVTAVDLPMAAAWFNFDVAAKSVP